VLRRDALALFSVGEVEAEARRTGFYRRLPRAIKALPFALCCALAAVVEGKRGFAGVWRLLAAAAGVTVARSAVTQRFGAESAQLLEALFVLAVSRLRRLPHPEMLAKLDAFRAVLADDGTVVALSPLLKKLFPATRTNSVPAAGKVHVRADLVHRRVLGVVVTGEREGELKVVRRLPVQAGTLYIRDLGYNDYDEFAVIVQQRGDLLQRLKDSANPRIVRVRHGLSNAAEVVRAQMKLNDPAVQFSYRRGTFDVDAEFRTKEHDTITLRVVGQYNRATGKWHCYLTSLDADAFSVEELATIYALRWVIELLNKLLKSSCHLDHVDTSDPGALRTHLYASLLSATILSAVSAAGAGAYGLPASAISPLVVGISAPLAAVLLLLLWLDRPLTPEALADTILRLVAVGCIDQNPNRTMAKWGRLARR
jgi:IS4 transposase